MGPEWMQLEKLNMNYWLINQAGGQVISMHLPSGNKQWADYWPITWLIMLSWRKPVDLSQHGGGHNGFIKDLVNMNAKKV